MIAKSILHESHIKETLQSDYLGLSPLTCRFFNEGRNDTYLITTDSKILFFRVYRSTYRTEAEIRSELAILVYLHSRGLNVSQPIPTLGGAYTITFQTPEGTRIGVLFEGINGESKKNRFDLSDSLLFGEFCGNLHRLLDAYDGGPLVRPICDLQNLLDESFDAVNTFFISHDDSFNYVRDVYDKLKQKLSRLIMNNKPRWGICHGDLNTGNVKFDHGKLGMYDFDTLCYSWHVYDISCFLWDLYYPISTASNTLSNKRKSLYSSFLEGYAKSHFLDSKDVVLSKYFLLVRDFWLLGIHSEERLYKGMSHFTKAYFDETIFNMSLQIKENDIDL